MKLDLFENLVQTYHLGTMNREPEELSGGITNKVYKIETSIGKFIVKMISSYHSNRIEESEKICEIAKQNGVPSLGAIKLDGKFVHTIQKQECLVYPFYEGTILKTKDITVEQVRLMARAMAQLHSIQIQGNRNTNYQAKYYPNDLEKLYQYAKQDKDPCFTEFINQIDRLKEVFNKVYTSYHQLSNQLSYIHRDYNRKNVLWKTKEDFSIIDWETATIGNPCIDFYKSAWFMTGDIQEDKFLAFKEEYFKIMKLMDNVEIGAYAGLIEECNWLEFSLIRALKLENSITEEEMLLGKESIPSSLKEILNYYDKINLMIELINGRN